MNRKIVKALYKKEITDILRDKKTILMMIVVPLILYPLIFVASFYLASTVMSESTSKAFPIAFEKFDNSGELETFFLEKQETHDFSFIFSHIGDFEENLQKGKIKAYVKKSISDNGIENYYICYDASDNTSSTVASMIQTMLSDYRNSIRVKLIEAADLDADYILYPITYEMENVASNEQTVGNMFGLIIPFLLISSVLMGAMYPAIDVTSGEKERGTLETLLTLPINNLEMIVSKFLATATIASGAAFLNVFSMGLLGMYFYSMMDASEAMTGTVVTFNASLYIPAIILTLIVAIVFAMLSSAVCLSVCIFARSFKEAQNYTTPIMLVFMFAGMATMIPSIELNSKTVLIPVVNFALLIADLFKFKYDFSLILYVILINLAYSIIAVIFMTKVFSSENILFSDGTNGIRIIEKRSDMKEKSIPGIGDVLLLLSVMLIVLLMIGSLLILKMGLGGSSAQQLIMLSFTLIYCIYIKVDFKKVFNLNIPKFSHLIAGIITWLGAYLLMLVGSNVFALFFPKSANSVNNTYTTLIGDSGTISVIVAMAVMPAICEEVLFRGFLFGTLSNRMKIWPAIIITGVVFGAYHMTLVQLIFVGILGAVMAYVVFRTKSIFVSMAMHFCNNLFATMIMLYPEQVEKIVPFLMDEKFTIQLAIVLSIAGAALFALGIFLVNKSTHISDKSREDI